MKQPSATLFKFGLVYVWKRSYHPNFRYWDLIQYNCYLCLPWCAHTNMVCQQEWSVIVYLRRCAAMHHSPLQLYRPSFKIRAQRLRRGIELHSHKNTVRKAPTLYARYYQLLSKWGLRGREKLLKTAFLIAPNCNYIILTPLRRTMTLLPLTLNYNVLLIFISRAGRWKEVQKLSEFKRYVISRTPQCYKNI